MTIKQKAEAERAVRRGVRLLDSTLPDWAMKIDLRGLDMEYDATCVLGHCYGDFWTALDELGKPGDNAWAIYHGFNAIGSSDDNRVPTPNGMYEYLALCWAPHIAKRQCKRQVKPRATA